MRTLPLVLLFALAPVAHADVYKCVSDDGRITYTNNPTVTRGCTVLSIDQTVTSVPPPRTTGTPRQATPSSFPRVTPDDQRNRDSTRRQVLEKELADEEKALGEAQAALAAEEARDAPEDRNARPKIVRQVTGPNGQVSTVTTQGPATINQAKTIERLKPFRDKVELHQRNVEALQREIGGLR